MLMPATTWKAKRQPSRPSGRRPPTDVAKKPPARPPAAPGPHCKGLERALKYPKENPETHKTSRSPINPKEAKDLEIVCLRVLPGDGQARRCTLQKAGLPSMPCIASQAKPVLVRARTQRRHAKQQAEGAATRLLLVVISHQALRGRDDQRQPQAIHRAVGHSLHHAWVLSLALLGCLNYLQFCMGPLQPDGS